MLCMVHTGSPWKKVNGKWCIVEQPQNRWISGKGKKPKDVIKKFDAKLVVEEEKAPEWVDTSFIKSYTDHGEMVNILKDIETTYPDIARRYTIGNSEEGRSLECIQITKDAKKPRKLLKPMVKYVANIHGDEAVGRELLIGLARYLTENYSADERVKKIVDSTDIHLMPSVNPDGNAANTRNNINDEDLNRAFPGWMDFGIPRNELIKDRQKEEMSVSLRYVQ